MIPEPTPASSLSPEELADQQPRRRDDKPCNNPVCPLVYRHRGPCCPPGVRQSPIQRAARVLQRDGGQVVMPVTRKMLYAALDVEEIAHDLHMLHTERDDGGSCGDCEFRAGFLLGRITREHP